MTDRIDGSVLTLALILATALAVGAPATSAASPPDRLNYEGVLRDAAGAPLDGSHDIAFRFYDVQNGGNAILVDLHQGAGAIVVDGGLFTAALGAGAVSDGPGPGVYTDLGAVFRDHGSVWMELEIEGETLAPRLEVRSAAYALNASHLAGRDPSEFLDTSSSAQAKPGPLTVGSLTIDGTSISTPDGFLLDSNASRLLIGAGDEDTDRLVLHAGNSSSDGRLLIEGDGLYEFWSGNGEFVWRGGDGTGVVSARLDGQGNLGIAGQISIAGGAPAEGRVLTTDAAGQATWQDPVESVSPLLLPEIADRLGVEDPAALPFAALRPLDCSGGPATLTLEIDGTPFGEALGFVGHDAISEVPVYRVALRLSDTTTDPGSLIGSLRRLTLTRAGQTTTWSGDVTESALAAVAPDGEAIYVVELRPSLARLERSTGFRIQQDVTVPGAVGDVLDTGGITNLATAIIGSHPPRPSIVQWKESQLDFVRRVAAEAGMHLHVEEGGSREILVLSDANVGFPSIGTLDYLGDQQDPGGGAEYVATFAATDRALPISTRVRGYNFQVPANDAVASVPVGGDTGVAYTFEGVETASDAAQRATIAAQRALTLAGLHAGSGNAAALKAGHRFSLDDLTVSGDLAGEYVVTAIEHFADATGACVEYGNTFQALPTTVTYRPPLATPKPRVEGPVLAEVGGPIGQGYHTDEHGRIKVRFLWDRDNPLDESSSAWIRVAAPPGKQDKDLWLPRVGSEVLVDFVDGDPDRPIVVGSLSNAADMPIFTLPDSTGPDFIDGGTHVDGALYLSDPRSALSPHGKAIAERIVFWDSTISHTPHARVPDEPPFDSAFKMDDELIVDGELRIGEALELTKDGTPGRLSWDGTSFALGGLLSTAGSLDVGGSLTSSGPIGVDQLTLGSDALISTSSLSLEAAGNLSLSGLNTSIEGLASVQVSASTEIDLTSTILDVNTAVSQFQGQVVAGGALVGQTTLNVTQSATIGTDLAVNGGDITSNTGLRLHATSRVDYSDGSVYTFLDNDSSETAAAHIWYHNGAPVSSNQIAELQEDGDLRIRGTISQNVAFDLAESFLAAEELRPGDVVRLDPTRAGAVSRTREAGDPLAIGVVSTNPGMVLGGAPFDAEELRAAWGDDVAARFEAERPEMRKRLLERRPDLAAALDVPQDLASALQAEGAVEAACLAEFHARLTAPVALAGRVPVRVDASFGAIRPGDALTPSPVPGVAMRLDGAGPSIGTALEGLGAGRGLVLALVERSRSGAAAEPVLPGPGRPDPTADAPGAPPLDGDVVDVALRPASSAAAEATPTPRAPWTVTRPSGAAGEPAEALLLLDTEGNLHLRGALQPDAMDLAEVFPLADGTAAEPGELLVVDTQTPGRYRPAARAADSAVVGIVSERPGVLLGAGIERILSAAPDDLVARWSDARLARDVDAVKATWNALVARFRATHAAIALSGTVPCKVDAGYGAIRPGDLLTTSPTAGHAMRAADPAPGTVVGKALEPLADGTGVIRVLVLMR